MTRQAWPLIWPCEPPEGSDERVDVAVKFAEQMLWARTGRRLGLREVTETYVVGNTVGVPDTLGPYPVVQCAAPNDGATLLVLSQQPVQDVSAVVANGVPLSLGTGYLRSGSRLTRPAGAAWTGVVTVTYQWGISLAEGTEWYGLAGLALGEVANEIFSLLCGGACKLPSRAVSVTRQGVTVQLSDPTTFVGQGLLGLPLADQLILTANPGRMRSRSAVYSPDLPRSAAVTAP